MTHGFGWCPPVDVEKAIKGLKPDHIKCDDCTIVIGYSYGLVDPVGMTVKILCPDCMRKRNRQHIPKGLEGK